MVEDPMTGHAGRLRDRLPAWLTGYPAAAAVLAAHVVLAYSSVLQKSNTFDELAHITAGLSYWKDHDYRFQPENGNLPQRWVALPLATANLTYPRIEEARKVSDVWRTGYEFLFRSGNDADSILRRARGMTVLLSAALGLLVYAWSRRLFGPGGGMLSLLLYALSPTILAHGSLATSDLAATAFFAASVGGLWRLFHKVSPGTVIWGGLALSGLFLSKMSAVLILPIGAVLLVLRLLGRRPLAVAFGKAWEIRGRIARAGALLAALAVQAVLVVAVIWAFYGFRYSAFGQTDPETCRFYRPWEIVTQQSLDISPIIDFARRRHLLPEAYLYGTAYTYGQAQGRGAFLNGRLRMNGWWYFFPYAFLVKTPLPTLAILVLAGAGVWLFRHGRRTETPSWRQALYRTAPLWILLGTYWVTAMTARLNIGHRHILPTYPPMFILAGAAACWFRLSSRAGRCAAAAVSACLVWLAGESAAIYPHYLAYFNEIVGGPRNGYKHLVDRSLDWGQDLPGLKRWLDKHGAGQGGGPPVFVYYFGSSSPAYYRIPAHCFRFPHRHPFGEEEFAPLTEGIYCISATALRRSYASDFWGRWSWDQEQTYQEVLAEVKSLETASAGDKRRLLETKGLEYWNDIGFTFHNLRLGRLCALLRRRQPEDNVGYSILIYRLTAEGIHQALFGPPAELLDSPESDAPGP